MIPLQKKANQTLFLFVCGLGKKAFIQQSYQVLHWDMNMHAPHSSKYLVNAATRWTYRAEDFEGLSGSLRSSLKEEEVVLLSLHSQIQNHKLNKFSKLSAWDRSFLFISILDQHLHRTTRVLLLGKSATSKRSLDTQ